jgi:hypothetical protein
MEDPTYRSIDMKLRQLIDELQKIENMIPHDKDINVFVRISASFKIGVTEHIQTFSLHPIAVLTTVEHDAVKSIIINADQL